MPSYTRAKNTLSSLNSYTKKLLKKAHTNEKANALLTRDQNKVLKSGAHELHIHNSNCFANKTKPSPTTQLVLPSLKSYQQRKNPQTAPMIFA